MTDDTPETPKKGPRYGGGSRKGKRNKRTLLKEAALAKAASAPMAKNAKGALRATDIMRSAANSLFKLAATRRRNRDEYVEILKAAAQIASDLAPYESPRLASTVLRGDPEQPVHHKIEIEFV